MPWMPGVGELHSREFACQGLRSAFSPLKRLQKKFRKKGIWKAPRQKAQTVIQWFTPLMGSR